jgi:hypothetical protein
MFCGEPCEELPYSNQETVVLSPYESSFAREINALVAVCDSVQGEWNRPAMAGRIPVERLQMGTIFWDTHRLREQLERPKRTENSASWVL